MQIEEEARWEPQDIALDIVYEDSDILVINKPRDLVVHPGAGNPDGTVLNALLHHYPEIADVPRAGIVHRLDKDTTGLMVVAKTVPAQTRLVEALQAREITREYEAVAIGTMTAGGTVEEPIARHSTKRTHMAVHPMGKPAVTHYRIMEHFRAHTRLRLRLETGRTHQIRVHMAYISHPLVGDPLYAAVHVRRRALRKPSSTRCAALTVRRCMPPCCVCTTDQRHPDGVACAAAAGHGRSDQRAEGGHRRIQRSDGLVMNSLILPDWPLPPGVKACSTTRGGGASLPPYDSLNLGTHVGDEEQR